ncbi:hypothetical protein Bbelb_278760 [Branchiostoma belcheri]|nr:hypothetical protein Bbelb_278760 [Branchiostoma belcheri]
MFNLYLEKIMQDTLQDYYTSISIGGRRICNLRFADDIDLLGGSNAELQELTDRLTQSADSFGMEASTEKSKVMVNSRNEVKAVIYMNGEQLEEVDFFTYLGGTITKDGSSQEEVRRRLGVATSAFSRLSRLWKTNNISFSVKHKLYKALVVTILLYGCETWTLLAETEMKIQSFETKCLRRLLQISYKEHKTNKYVRELVQSLVGPQEPLLTTVRRRILQRFGHITRHTSLAKTILQGTLEGGRKRGRQRKTWLDNIKEWTSLNVPELLAAADRRETLPCPPDDQAYTYYSIYRHLVVWTQRVKHLWRAGQCKFTRDAESEKKTEDSGVQRRRYKIVVTTVQWLQSSLDRSDTESETPVEIWTVCVHKGVVQTEVTQRVKHLWRAGQCVFTRGTEKKTEDSGVQRRRQKIVVTTVQWLQSSPDRSDTESETPVEIWTVCVHKGYREGDTKTGVQRRRYKIVVTTVQWLQSSPDRSDTESETPDCGDLDSVCLQGVQRRRQEIVVTTVQWLQSSPDRSDTESETPVESWTWAINKATCPKPPNTKPSAGTESKGLVVLPYIKDLSEALWRIFISHGISTCFKPTTTLRHILGQKDKASKEKKCGVIYHIPCQGKNNKGPCQETYIGETERSLKARFQEHTRPRSASSEVSQHMESPGHVVSLDTVRILHTEQDYFLRGVKEAMFIQEEYLT